MVKIKKILSLVLAAAILTLCLAGCGLLEPEVKDFSKSGFTITLNDSFFEKEMVGYTAYYQSIDVLVLVIKEEFSMFPAEYQNLSVGKYADLVVDINKLGSVEPQVKGDYAEFDYEKNVSGEDYYYYARCFVDTDAYWLVQFACFLDKKDAEIDNILKLADSVKFD